MPVKFWNDIDNKKYKSAYFDKYNNIWHHGDFAKITKNGGFVIFGRSDATLNPGGVRLGTAEIYNVVEKFEEIQESIVIGQSWNNDIRIILFVVLNENYFLTKEVVDKMNDNQYGLSSGIYTKNINRGLRVSNAIRAGITFVNTYRLISPSAPFGGMKDSGYGKEAGIESIKDYTRIKTTWFNTSDKPMDDPFTMG